MVRESQGFRGQTWSQSEIRCLIDIWSDDFINAKLSTTHKNSAVYAVFSQRLMEKGYVRSVEQCRIKAKKLRAEYFKVRESLSRTDSDGTEKERFPWYDELHQILGKKVVIDPVDMVESVESPSPANTDYQAPIDYQPTPEYQPHADYQPLLSSADLSPETEDASADAYTVPSKKRKTTIMDQVSTLVSATVAQLKEMDAAMQTQEDARLQRLMDHEKEMQNSLMSQLMAMHDRISRENHERQVQLVDRILARLPSSSSAPSSGQ